MNKTIILLTLLFCSSLAKTQVPYTPFDFESGIWKERSYTNYFFTYLYQVYPDGDTIVNNKTYQKLKRKGIRYEYDSPWQTPLIDSMFFDSYYGAVRENNQRQVELLRNNGSTVIIYDFNYSVGDTVHSIADYLSGYTAIISKIDTVEVCGTLRNRHWLNIFEPSYFAGQFFWIEGVGSLSGIIPNYSLFESGGYLENFSMENCIGGLEGKGTIKTPNDLGVGLVEVDMEIEGIPIASFDTTDSTGIYELNFQPDTTYNDFEIFPEKNINPLNGVTTFDLTFIVKHILGTEQFTSPYQFIAADADDSGKVTTFDIVILKRLILGLDSEFQGTQKSWRFVDAKQTFELYAFGITDPIEFDETIYVDVPNVINPYIDPVFGETRDFIGVKIGDLNGSANPDF